MLACLQISQLEKLEIHWSLEQWFVNVISHQQMSFLVDLFARKADTHFCSKTYFPINRNGQKSCWSLEPGEDKTNNFSPIVQSMDHMGNRGSIQHKSV